MTKKKAFKAGQYYAAKYRGNNGDLIVGMVRSVRANGEIILVNMLSQKVSTKKASVLSVRNKRISKTLAHELQALWDKTHDLARVRAAAVAMRSFFEEATEPTPEPKVLSRPMPKIMSHKTMGKIRDLIGNIHSSIIRIIQEELNE